MSIVEPLLEPDIDVGFGVSVTFIVGVRVGRKVGLGCNKNVLVFCSNFKVGVNVGRNNVGVLVGVNTTRVGVDDGTNTGDSSDPKKLLLSSDELPLFILLSTTGVTVLVGVNVGNEDV